MNAEGRRSPTEPGRLAVVALGSNLGDSSATMQAAMDQLEFLAAAPLLRSSLWRSAPLDCPPGSPSFINAVVALETAARETPESLLPKLQAIERRFGRERKGIVNEARTLDLDLISFGNEVRNTPALTLPHPRAHLRAFVLGPLAEILPEFQASTWNATARTLFSALAADQIIERLP